MMKKKIALGLAVMAISSTALAQGFYAGIGYNSLELTSGSAPGFKADVDMLSGVLGYRLNPNLALEGRLGVGVNDESFGLARAELDSYIGANVVGTLPLTPNGWALYGTVGYGFADFSGRNAAGLGFRDDDGSVNYGAGVQYATGPYTFRAGYENLYDKGSSEADGFAITATYAF